MADITCKANVSTDQNNKTIDYDQLDKDFLEMQILRSGIHKNGEIVPSAIEIVLNGTKLDAFVDTGCPRSVMSMAVAVGWGLSHLVDPREEVVITGAKGQRMKIDGTIMACDLEIGGFSFLWPIQVLKQMPLNLIIGADILEHMKAKINYSNQCVMLKLIKNSPHVVVPLVEKFVFDMNFETELTTAATTELDFEKLDFHKKRWLEAERSMGVSSLYWLKRWVTVKINGFHFDAAIDTGASHSVLTERVVNNCRIGHLVDHRFNSSALCIDGTVENKGIIHKCGVTIGNTFFFGTFCVSTLVVIGRDMLRQLKANVNYDIGELQYFMNNKRIRHKMPYKRVQKSFM